MRHRLSHVIVLVAVLAPGVWCLGATLIGTRVFAYRDTAHFYFPLYRWMARCWGEGEPPLWNPLDNNGIPLVAESTAAGCYPGKLLFALPGDFVWRFNWYVHLHLLLAAGGAYAMARCWHPRSTSPRFPHARADGPGSCDARETDPSDPPLSVTASGLVAVSYTWGGVVLFQTANVVFLVGAAWLPLATLAIHRTLSQRSVRWGVGLGICLAMMVLGGDAQLAYFCGLSALLYGVLLPRRTAATNGRRSVASGLRHVATTGGLLMVAAVSGVALSAAQIVPSLPWTRQSDRALFTYPRSIYEVATYLRETAEGDGDAPGESAPRGVAGIMAGLFGEPVRGEHHEQLYRFSVAPWRWLETVWPNLSGRSFPENHRWLTAIGGEDRIWVPSLYGGLLATVFCWSAWQLRAPQVRVRWLSWLALLAVVASFGGFGPGSLVQKALGLWGPHGWADQIGAPTGGLYWLLVVVLPGYAQFRYPAKLLVPAALAIAYLAGIAMDRVLNGDHRRVSRVLAWTSAASLLLGAVVWASRPWWSTWLAGARPDELFGPVSASGAWRDAWSACLHAAVVSGTAWWLLRRRLSGVTLGACLLLLTAGELAWANGWLVLTAPSNDLNSAPLLRRHPDGVGEAGVYRWPRRDWVPGDWPREHSAVRASECLQWDIATFYGKHHLPAGWRSVESAGTLNGAVYRAAWPADASASPCPALLNLLGASHWLVPSTDRWPAGTSAESRPSESFPEVALWYNPDAFPRAWLIYRWQPTPRPVTASPRRLRTELHRSLFPDGQPLDFRQLALVDPGTFDQLGPSAEGAAHLVGDDCRLVQQTATRIEIEVVLPVAGLVVINSFYDPSWVVDVVDEAGGQRRGAVVRVNHLMQGVPLPAGRHRLLLRYVPRPFFVAATVSVAAWCVAVAFLGAGWVTRRRAQPGQRPSDLIIS